MSRLRRVPVFSGFSSLFVLLLPLSAIPQQATEPTPVFRSQTELVLVPVVVNDKSGAHVPNLRPQDFELTDDGRPQKIATFEEVAPKPQTALPETPGQYTNYVPDAAARRLTIILLDQVNTPYLNQKDAQQKLLKAISSNMDAQDPIALVSLKRKGLRVLHDFTTDPAVLAAALRKASGEFAAPASVDTQALAFEVEQLDTLGLPTDTPWNVMQERSLIERTLAQMQDLAKAFAGMPGRKALIWVSAGFPFQLRMPIGGGVGWRRRAASGAAQTAACGSAQYSRWSAPSTEMFSSYEKAYKILNSANIAVYSIDVREIYNPGYQDPGADWTTGFNCFLAQNHDENSNTLVNFAKETGGKAWVNASDFTRGFRMAMDDSRSYYLLGYYLNRTDTKTGWHKLHVKVARSGADVRARAGFLIPEKSVSASEQKSAMESALLSPLSYTAVPVSVRLEPGTEAGHMNFVLTVASGGFTIDAADNNHAELEVIAALVNEIGDARVAKQQTLDLHLKPESMTQIAAGGLVYRNSFEIPAGEYVARFAVRDVLSGRIGSVTVPLKRGR